MQTTSIDLGDLNRWIEPPKIAAKVQPLAEFENDILKIMSENPEERGDPLPWHKTHKCFRLRPSEMTVWAGANESFKSTILSQVFLDLAMRGRNVLLASLEESVGELGHRLIMQACCSERPSAAAVHDFLESTKDRLWILNVQGRLRSKEAVALLRWAAFERGMQHIALDNLTKIVSAANEATMEQQNFLAEAHGVALDSGAHVHIVAHVRKPEGAENIPGRYDIRGSSTISDQADNVVMVWRNTEKEFAIDEGRATDQQRQEADVHMKIDKQRHWRFKGTFKLWSHVSRQFLPDGITPPIAYAFPRGLPQ